MDYESMILARDERNDHGETEYADEITIRTFDPATFSYRTVKTLYGQAARDYMEVTPCRKSRT